MNSMIGISVQSMMMIWKDHAERCKYFYSIAFAYRYCTGKPPQGYVEPELVTWFRPEEMPIKAGCFPQFIDDGVAANDVI